MSVSENFLHTTAMQEWSFCILPAFQKMYPNGDFPSELMIIPGKNYDGFGSPGLVGIDEAVIEEPVQSIRLFILAHETSHCVVYLECEKQGLVTPNTNNGTNKKKHEMMADLIATHVLRLYFPNIAEQLRMNFKLLAQKLGSGDAEHPSGSQRIKNLEHYMQKNDFNTLFQTIAAKNFNY